MNSLIELRPYQTEIANKATKIIKKFGLVYLAMQPRTGKTITSLQICNDLNLINVLFVTKKKAISSVESDCKFYPQLKVEVLNYEQLHNGVQPFDIVIIDEAHTCSAFAKPALRAKQLKEICKGKPIIFLSGTPTPEGWSQIYHQLWISSFSPYKNYINFYNWANVYVKKKIKYVYNREITDYSNANIERIKEETKHLFLSYTQEQAGFDISITEKIITVSMPENIKEIIKAIIKDKVYEKILADTAVKEMSKVHQLCSGSVIDEEGNYIIYSDYKAKAIKEKFNGKKIAIFYKFKSEFEMLKGVFENEYTADPNEFQNGLKNVFLGQFVSSREGVRLDKAEAIIFFNIDFSFLSYEQGKNRIISKERSSEAVLYWVFSDCGIENKIHRTVQKKENYTIQHYINQ